MSTRFLIQSSDPSLLEKATRIAREFAQEYISDDVVGIVFLGAIVRGYFDHSADIDIALFRKRASAVSIPNKFLKIDGIEVQCWLSDYESELTIPWEMSKRWTYSQGQIYYDPQGKISKLLDEKVPLKPEERQWLLMSEFVLSEWYINRLTHLWVERGNLISAHHMFDQGLNYFFGMLLLFIDSSLGSFETRNIEFVRFAHTQFDAIVTQIREMRGIPFKVRIESDGLEFGGLSGNDE